MPIPKEILSVERPESTKVKLINGTYYVYLRKEVFKNGRSTTIDLECLGKIDPVNLCFVHNKKTLTKQYFSCYDYGEFALVDKVANSLLTELRQVYLSDKESKLIYTLALLRTIYSTKAKGLENRYLSNFVSIKYPELNFSEANISNFFTELGRRPALMFKFMQNRIKEDTGRQLIDGILKPGESSLDSYSEYSLEDINKGYPDITLFYVYSVDKKEPLGCKIYGGDLMDVELFTDIIGDLEPKEGLIIGDKDFTRELTIEKLDALGLNYILPCKKDSPLLNKHVNFDKLIIILNREDKNIVAYKNKIDDIHYVYAFKDFDLAYYEQRTYIDNQIEKNKNFQMSQEEQSRLGVSVYISNVDDKAENIYEYYEQRKDIGQVFKVHKQFHDFTTISYQRDVKVIATEFINFLSTIMTFRIRKYLDLLNLTKEYTIDEIFEICSYLKKIYNNVDWKFAKTTIANKKVYKLLDIV